MEPYFSCVVLHRKKWKIIEKSRNTIPFTAYHGIKCLPLKGKNKGKKKGDNMGFKGRIPTGEEILLRLVELYADQIGVKVEVEIMDKTEGEDK